VLATRFQVHATRGNLNNHIGVPLTLLNAPEKPDVVIVEMGANHQREIDFLCEVAEPSHGYITNIGLAHLEGFGGEHGVYLGKKELFDWLGSHEGTAFVLTSDVKVVEAAKSLTAVIHVVTEGWEWQSVKGSDRPQLCDNMGQCWSLHLEGQYNLANCLAAVTIGQHFGVPKDMAMQAVSNYRPENHRSQVLKTARNWVLLDAYNANPSSNQAAMDAFAAKAHAAPLLIMGDMAELGDASLDAHQRVIQLALELEVELWTVGPWFGKAKQASQSDHRHFDAVDDLKQSLGGLSNRQILIKGSRSMALEQLMPAL
jgi:UDP-N-acetylmuramoyl-tripeptide--D-alanyl-D-alanine ligase